MISFDSNILIYAYDHAPGLRREKARELLLTTTGGVLLWQVAVEFVAVSRKKTPAGVSREMVWTSLDEIRGRFPLMLPNENVLTRAREITGATQCQFWDAMIYAAALECGVTELLSEDVPGQEIAGLKIINPFA